MIHRKHRTTLPVPPGCVFHVLLDGVPVQGSTFVQVDREGYRLERLVIPPGEWGNWKKEWELPQDGLLYLTRIARPPDDLYRWHEACAEGPIQPKLLAIFLTPEDRSALLTHAWFQGCHPSRWERLPPDPASGAPAREVIILHYEVSRDTSLYGLPPAEVERLLGGWLPPSLRSAR